MKTMYFDRITLKGQSSKNNTTISLEVNDDLELSKTIQEYEKDIQKVNENNEPLYTKNIYGVKVHENITGYEETIEETDTPVMISIHKSDLDGNLLYTEFVYDEEMNIIDKIETIEPLTEKGYSNQPIMLEVQKVTPIGTPLFLKPIIETWEETVIIDTEETTESINILTWTTKEVITTVPVIKDDMDNDFSVNLPGDGLIDEGMLVETEEITETITLPETWEDNEPIMIPVYKDVTVSIAERPEEFSILEVLPIIYEQELADSKYENILADMFMNEDDIDFTYEEHSANTGAFIFTLLPKGKAKLKEVILEAPSRKFELLKSEIPECVDIFINDVKFVNNLCMLPRLTDYCRIRFENTSDKYVDIKSYCIAY